MESLLQSRLCKRHLWDEQSSLLSMEVTVFSDPRSKLVKSKLHNWNMDPGRGLEDIKGLLPIVLRAVMALCFHFFKGFIF